MPQSVGTAYVELRFDVAQAAKDLNSTLKGAVGGAGAGAGEQLDKTLSTKLGEIANKGTRAGRQLSFGLTAPLVAFGKKSVDAFSSFDTSMTRINSLVGVSRAQTDQWSKEVIGLGNQFGLSADDVANGLYFITSSGIDTAHAMDVLKVASMGAGVGLGSVESVADLLTSAMNGYGAANLSAAHAGDVLTIAVREGKAEADDMAGALGRVIPMASQMGVSFEEVSGIASALTLTGNSADEAATQLTQILSTLADMPAGAQKALKAYTGLEYETVRADVKSKGLRKTLQEITVAFKGNETAMAEVFGNIRALRGVMGAFGSTADQTNEIIDKMTSETGTLAAAWEHTARSPAKKLEIAMAELNNAMTELGASVVPVFASVAEGAAIAVGAFAALPDPVKNTAVGLLAVGAAAGPVVYSISSLANVAKVAVTGFEKLSPKFAETTNNLRFMRDGINASTTSGKGFIGNIGGMTGVLGAVGAAATAAAISFALWNKMTSDAANDAKFLGDTFNKSLARGGIVHAREQIGKAREQIAGLNKDIEASNNRKNQSPFGWLFETKYRNQLEAAANELGNTADKTQEMSDITTAMGRALNRSEDDMFKFLLAEKAAGREYHNSKDAIDAYTSGIKEHNGAVQQAETKARAAKGSFAAIADTIKESSTAFFGMFDAQKKYADGLKAVDAARKGVDEANQKHQDSIKKVGDAERRLADAQRKAVESTNALKDARQELADAQTRLNDILRGPSAEDQLSIEEAQLSLEEARKRLATGKFETPLDRRRAELDVRRAQLDLDRQQKDREQKIADARKDVEGATRGVKDAEDAVEDARRAADDADAARLQAIKDREQAFLDIKTATDKVSEAENNLIKPAMDAAYAQDNLNNMFRDGTFNVGGMLGQLSSLVQMYPNLAPAVKPYIDKLYELKALNEQLETPFGGRIVAPNRGDSGPNSGRLQGRAIGGSVNAGSLYRVNERSAPELFSTGGRQYLMPLTSGNVSPLPANLPVRGGDGITFGDINVYGATQPVQTAYEVRRQIRSKPSLVGRR